MSRKEPDGDRFDPFRSEFVDRRFLPPTPKVLGEIQGIAEAMLIHTAPHAVLERSFIINGNPAIVRKHLERKQVNSAGNEDEYPFGEIFIFDRSGDRLRDRYTANDSGSVFHSPEFLDGYDWQVDNNGNINTNGNHPRYLEHEEINDLVVLLSDNMGVAAPAGIANLPPVVQLVNMAAETGIRATIKSENVPLRPKLDTGSCNDWIDVEFTEREGILPGMETIVKLKLVIAQDNARSVRELTTFTVFENGVAKYEFDLIDFSEVGKDKNDDVTQEEINRRSENMKWNNLASNSGLDRATQEHAIRTRDLLKAAHKKVKWHLLKT